MRRSRLGGIVGHRSAVSVGPLPSDSSIGVEFFLVRIDLHLHTNASRDCLVTPARIMAAARRRGLDGIAVTDHNATRAWNQFVPFRGQGLTLVFGEEVFTTDGEIIGLFLTHEVPPGRSALESARAIKDQGGVVVVPHPFDRIRKGPLTRSALDGLVRCQLVDAIETFNARTTFAVDNVAAAAFAREYGLPTVGGSDAHTAREVGIAYTELPTFTDAASFVASLPAARPMGVRSPAHVHLTTAFVKRWKRRQAVAA